MSPMMHVAIAYARIHKYTEGRFHVGAVQYLPRPPILIASARVGDAPMRVWLRDADPGAELQALRALLEEVEDAASTAAFRNLLGLEPWLRRRRKPVCHS